MMKRFVFLAVFFALGAYTNSHATLIGDCDASIAGNVVTNSGCQVSDETNDSVSGSDPANWTVNQDEFFGGDTWDHVGKYEGSGDNDEIDEVISFTTTSGGSAGLTGTWTLVDGVWDIYSEILLVFKDGSDTSLVGYLLTAADGLSGAWSSPFTDPPFDTANDQTKEVSHISVYTGEGAEVPEPGSLLLLGSGLVGIGAWRRRRSQRS